MNLALLIFRNIIVIVFGAALIVVKFPLWLLLRAKDRHALYKWLGLSNVKASMIPRIQIPPILRRSKIVDSDEEMGEKERNHNLGQRNCERRTDNGRKTQSKNRKRQEAREGKVSKSKGEQIEEIKIRYEVCRKWDATHFGPGIGIVGCVEREEIIEVGYHLYPISGEFKDDLEKELLTGIVNAVLKAGEYDNPHYDADFRIGLEGMVEAPKLSKKYKKTEDEILSKYFHLSSEGRDKILAANPGKSLLLDEVIGIEDKGNIGVIWFSGGDLFVYDCKQGDIIHKRSPGLGINYGTAGKNDFIHALKEIKGRNEKLTLDDLFKALDSIRDWDYYHWRES